MSDHEEVREWLPAAALGELDEAQTKQVDKHLESCDECRDELRRMREVLVLAGTIREATLDDAVCREARESVLEMIAELEARQRRRYAWMKYAAAAMLVLGAWLVLHFFMGEQKVPEPPTAQHQKKMTLPTPSGTVPGGAEAARQAQVASEARLAEKLFNARDVRGLAQLYRLGEPETKTAVIDYLRQIGSEEAMRTLEQLRTTETEEPPAEELPQGMVPVERQAADMAAPKADEPAPLNPTGPVTSIAVKVSQHADGETDLSEYRLRLPSLFREDHSYRTIIDDGRRRLTLDHQNKTGRFSPSHKPNLKQHEAYQYAALLRDEPKDNLVLTELAALSSGTTRVFDVQGLNPEGLVRVWMDAESRLTQRFSSQVGEPAGTMEAVFDYAPLDDAVFAMEIPPGYTELEEQVPGTFTGYVTDQNGNPVSGARVFVKAWPVNSNEPLEGVSDAGGQFSVAIEPGKMPTNQQETLGSPIVIWAQLPDRPDLIAWTILQNEYDLQWRPHAERIVNREAIVQVSENYLNGPYEWCRGASNLVLVMEPAGWVTGTVIDPQGTPVAGARVRVGFAPAGQKGQTTGTSMDFWQTTVHTNESGCFEAGFLPMLWEQSRLEFFLQAEGYVQANESITLQEPLEILETTFAMIPQGPTVRGYIKDNYGTPLANRTVAVTVPGQNISGCSANTNADGYFEIANCPAGVDLKVTAVLDHNPASPDPRNENQDPFVYYPNASERIACEPGRPVYEVHLTTVLPELVVEVEVIDSQGRPLADFPVEINNSENPLSPFWRQDAGLIGLTGDDGRVRFVQVPRLEGLLVAGGIGIHCPKPHELPADFRGRFEQALSTCGQYGRIEVSVALEEGRGEYFIQMEALTPQEKQQRQL